MFFEGPTLYTMIFTEQTFGLYQLDKHMSFRHAGFFLVVAELSRWNLSLFLIKIYFSWNSSNPPFGNFRSTLESLLGNLVPKRCMPMQTSPPMVPARLEREVINPDPSLAHFFFCDCKGLLSFTLYHLVKWEFLASIYIYIANVLQAEPGIIHCMCKYVHTYTPPPPKIDDWSLTPMDEEIKT